tara:strand:- start:1511 stop:1765 length:255 start_codon:yes stop_codon:yes gene_type:complete
MNYIYKVHIDLSKSSSDIKDLGIPEFASKDAWLLVKADNPDDACMCASTEMHEVIKSSETSEKYAEAADIIKKNMKIVKVIQIT